ncbi:hypothetical protein Tco_0323750 [Tanacetum coccineum]
MGNEKLSTIPEKESDKFIKSNVEDLVPIPSKSEDTSESDSDCDLPSCDDFSLINGFEEKIENFSNPLFDLNNPRLCFVNLCVTDATIRYEGFRTRWRKLMRSSCFLDMDISTDIENGYHDSEGDIIYLESLLINDTITNLPPEDCPDLKESRARGFVFTRSSILRMLIYGNPIS